MEQRDSAIEPNQTNETNQANEISDLSQEQNALAESIQETDFFKKEEEERSYDPNDIDWKQQEGIIDNLYSSGMILVKTRDLLINGVEPAIIDTFDFTIGKYRIYRLVVSSPYKIEKLS